MVRLLLLFLVPLACAQPGPQRAGVQLPAAQGAAAAGLGGAGLALPTDGWTRVGALAQWTAPGGTLGAEQRFGLAELREGSAQAVGRWGYTTVMLQAASFGEAAFRSSQFGLTLARRLFPARAHALSVGLRVQTVSVSTDGYGSGVGFGLSPSLWTEVTHALSVAVEAQNVAARDVAGREPLPSALRAGLAYAPTERVRLAADASHDPDFGAAAHVGAEVDVVGAVTARAGVGTSPEQVGLGVGLRLGSLRADLAASRHLLLGWSPSIEVGWAW